MYTFPAQLNRSILIRSLLLFLLLTIFIPGCTRKKETPKIKPPLPVAVATVTQKDVPLSVSAIGNVEAFNSVPVRAQVNGVVSRVHFQEGQDVRRGDILFTIDPGPYNAALNQAEANLARDVAQARNADEQAKRYASLLNDGIVTKEQYDQLRTNADAYSAAVAADRAAVENARIQLSYCYIRSPIPGRTGSLLANLGTLVKANDSAALVTINQISPIYVSFTVPEKQLAAIKPQAAGGKMVVEAKIPNDAQGGERGLISFLDNAVDINTGTIRLKGTFANGNHRLWPGQFVNVSLTLGTRKNALTVPAAAVQNAQQGQFVFVVDGNQKAEQRPVISSIAERGELVIDQGLNAGEIVVTDGMMRLTPGARIEINDGRPGKLQLTSTVKK